MDLDFGKAEAATAAERIIADNATVVARDKLDRDFRSLQMLLPHQDVGKQNRFCLELSCAEMHLGGSSPTPDVGDPDSCTAGASFGTRE